MNTLRRLLGLAWPFRVAMGQVAALGTVTVAGNVALLFGAALLIARSAERPEVLALLPLVGLVRLASLTRAVSRYLERYFSHDITFRILGRLQVWFYQRLERLSPCQLEELHSGDLFRRLAGDVESLKDFYLRVVAPPLTALLVLAGMFLFLAFYRLDLALAYTAVFLAAAAGVSFTALRLNRTLGRSLVEARARLDRHLVDSLQGLREIVAFGRTESQLARVGGIHGTYLRLFERSQLYRGFSNALMGLAGGLAMWAVLFLGIRGHLPGVYLGAVALAALAGFEALAPLPQVFGCLEQNLAAAGRLFALADLAPAVADPVSPAAPPPGEYGLTVRDLGFRYGPREPWVLQGVSFTLPPGGRVAVVGPSGAGKSTLVRVLLRFADYTEGSVRLSGRELKEYGADKVRERLAVADQKPHLFYASVRENLLLARPGATEGELTAAAAAAFADEFIRALPQGWATGTGEGGFKVSGGQRRRLAIARALLKDAPILVLDEPTNGLDAACARAVVAAVNESLAGRSLLLVTHHLVGLEAMDEIIVLDRGRIVERGREEELLAAGGLYRRLWELQRGALN